MMLDMFAYSFWISTNHMSSLEIWGFFKKFVEMEFFIIIFIVHSVPLPIFNGYFLLLYSSTGIPYNLHVNPFRYIVRKYFSSVLSLSLHFTDCFFCYAETFQFDAVFLILFLVPTVVISEKSLLKSLSSVFFPVLFSRDFIASTLTFKSLIISSAF